MRQPQWCTVDGWRVMGVGLPLAQRAQASAPKLSYAKGRQVKTSAAVAANANQPKNFAKAALTAGREPLSRAKPLKLDVTAEGLPLEQPPVLP
jgi:hypothetical protein